MVTKKRQSKNVENVVAFFSRKKSRGMMHVLRNLGNPFDKLEPEEVNTLFNLYAKHPQVFEAFATYARQHPKVITELSTEDLADARDILQVKHVMES